MFLKLLLLLIISVLFSSPAFGQAVTVFKGQPTVKISEGGVSRLPEQLSHNQSANLECVISEIGGRYYWASRENKELLQTDGGAFITFVARDGSGAIRIIKPGLKTAASLMSDTEAKFDYVEHLLIGLRSVTYYGVAQ
jgi:hypothetical protein